MMANLLIPLAHLGICSQYAIAFALGAFIVSMVLAAWRLLRGPAAEDRILALDSLYMNALSLTVLLGIVFSTSVYFDVALVMAMLGFIGTVAMAKHLEQKGMVE